MKLPKAVRDHFVKLGKKGGKARAKTLTPERRSEIARMGAHAKHQQKKSRGGRSRGTSITLDA